MTTTEEAKFYRDKHVLETGGKNSDRGTAINALGVSPENFDKIKGSKPETKLSDTSNFNPLSMLELMAYETPEEEWLIQNLIQPKKIIILAGASGTFKSWLEIYMACAVGLGTPFVDMFPTKKNAVLFIDRENSLPELKKRVEMIGKGMGIENYDLPVFFLSEQPVKLDNPLGTHYLEKFVNDNHIKLIICDTYRRLVSYEENDANKVSMFFTDILKPLCERTGVSFLFIHHHKKGKAEGDERDLIRGSSDFVNFVDGVLQVSRVADLLTVKQTKSRGAKELSPFSLRIETDEDTYFRFKYEGESRPLDKMHKAVEALLLWIKNRKIQSFKTKEAQDIAFGKGIKKMNFYAALSKMEEIGEIEKIGHGEFKVKIQQKMGDFGIVQSPITKSIGLLDNLPINPSSPNSTIGQVGQYPENHEKNAQNDLVFFEVIKVGDKP